MLRQGLFLIALLIGCRADSTRNYSESKAEASKVEMDVCVDIEPMRKVTLDYDTSIWTELTLSDSIVLDLRYATLNNFTETVIYPCARCFLRRPIAKKLVQINQQLLLSKGLRIKLFDCYRPLQAQQKLWDIVPDETYVANPTKGSMHNRGAAVDLTLVGPDGNELNMGSDFDEFGSSSRHDNYKHPKQVLDNRAFLKSTMEVAGFKSIKSEWWHYSLSGTGSPITDWQWECPQ